MDQFSTLEKAKIGPVIDEFAFLPMLGSLFVPALGPLRAATLSVFSSGVRGQHAQTRRPTNAEAIFNGPALYNT